MKTFDGVLKQAFLAGVGCGQEIEGARFDRQTAQHVADQDFRTWRRRFAGLATEDADSTGAETSVAGESGSDTERSETVSGSSSDECTCGSPYFTHTNGYHSYIQENRKGSTL